MGETIQVKVLGDIHHAGKKYDATSGVVLLPSAAARYHIKAGTAQEVPSVDQTPAPDLLHEESTAETDEAPIKAAPRKRGRRT